MSDMIKIGGLWKAKDATAKAAFSGKMGETQIVLKPGMKLLVFPNTFKKEGSNAPDYNLFAAESKVAPLPANEKVDDGYFPF